MNLVKSVMKKQENELYKKQSCRVFAVKVNTQELLGIIINCTVSKLQSNGFMHYLNNHIPQPVVRMLDYPQTYSTKEDDIVCIQYQTMLQKEFNENGGKEECAILFNDDLAIAYPDNLHTISERYPGIQVWHQSYFFPELKKLHLI